MDVAIETNHLLKRYGRLTAVDDLSLRVQRGEIYAFIGLNGAGKTTTIRLLLGMIKPSAGTVRVLGIPIQAGGPKPWARVGYLVETAAAYPELTVRENLDALRRLRPGTRPAAVPEAIAALGLAPNADRQAGTLSRGNAQRLGLAKALLHRPELLILDEPANGLDPAGIVEIRHLLLDLTQKQGVTVFMSTHILSEVARLADRVGIIHDSRLILELEKEALEQRRRRWLVTATHNPAAAAAILAAAGWPAEPQGDGTLRVAHPDAVAHPEAVAGRLVEAGHPPTRLAVEQEELEPYFLRLIGMNQP